MNGPWVLEPGCLHCLDDPPVGHTCPNCGAHTPYACIACHESAQPEHTPCCSSHGKPMCCFHYCRAHFVEVDACDPQAHARARAVSS